MSMMNFFVLTSAERTAAIAFNTEEIQVQPRAIDNASPGVGINLNDNATSYDPADPVTLVGKFVAPKRIVDDPEQPSGLKAYLLGLPWCSLETETIFAPDVEG